MKTPSSLAPHEPTGAELRRNRDVLEERLRAEIATYELRYELPSADLEAAIERGDIRETAEIAAWVIACRTLRALVDERQARPE